MLTNIAHIIDWLLWAIIAASTLYVVVFAFASLLPSRNRKAVNDGDSGHNRFIVLFPAYHEDEVILSSVETFLKQDYPRNSYQVIVISDHMTAETNDSLACLPISLLTPTFKKSSKAHALQYAISNIPNTFPTGKATHAVILDADNHVAPDFLSRLDNLCRQGYRAIQCHRTAKNADNNIAALDGVSEEINNTIFRKGHNRIGLSSALIGSGMCFDYDWFHSHVSQLRSAVEDRELEAMLLKERVHIHYAENILVMDEKVSNTDNFQRQRLRWMTGQVQALFHMLPYLPKALIKGNVNYIDKTIQQALIPRSILLAVIPIVALVITIVSPLQSIKWWALFLLLCLSLLIALPPQLRTSSLFKQVLTLPRLVWHLLKNLFHIDRKNTDFIHTSHNK